MNKLSTKKKKRKIFFFQKDFLQTIHLYIQILELIQKKEKKIFIYD